MSSIQKNHTFLQTNLSSHLKEFFGRIAGTKSRREVAVDIHEKQKEAALTAIFEEMRGKLGETPYNQFFFYRQTDTEDEPTILEELIFRAIDPERGTVQTAYLYLFFDRLLEHLPTPSDIDPTNPDKEIEKACNYFNRIFIGNYLINIDNRALDATSRPILCLRFSII